MLQLLTFTTLVQRFAASAQAAATALLDFTVGSVLLSFAQANASIALWMQWLILLVLAKTRAATSIGPDLDSWMADFQFTRLLATTATGQVTVARFTPTASALVPVGATMKTTDGLTSFTVIADATQTFWNAAQNGYLIPAATASGIVTVQAVVAGTGGNVLAGAITLLATGISGIDTVSNALAFTNGLAAETDAAFRTRFISFINTRSLATDGAVNYAISSVQQGLSWTIQENTNTIGVYTPGTFVVTVNDGSGSPPSALLAAIGVAVNAVRPVGSVAVIQGPSAVTVTVSLTITVAAPGVKATLQPLLAASIASYINGLGMGVRLPYLRIAQLAFDFDPTIANVTALTVNSGTSDIVPTQVQVCEAGTITVN